MQKIDWIVLVITLLFIVIYGVWKTKGSTKNVEDFILGNNETPWWTVGLSVMATQASAITFLSTPGQAYHDGMGFVQFYFVTMTLPHLRGVLIFYDILYQAGNLYWRQ